MRPLLLAALAATLLAPALLADPAAARKLEPDRHWSCPAGGICHCRMGPSKCQEGCRGPMVCGPASCTCSSSQLKAVPGKSKTTIKRAQ
jgi:hypothetical protein